MRPTLPAADAEKPDPALLLVDHVAVLAALGRGDFAYAYRQVTTVVTPGTSPVSAPEVLWFILDLAEAAQRSGHRSAAEAHAAAFDTTTAAAVVSSSPRLLLHARTLAALVAPEGDADARFREALDTPGAAAYPFDLARVHLLYGEYLRRTFSPSQARDQLLVARRTFADLGAGRWSERADAEIRAARADRAGATESPLTPQEMEIALLAASGLTNKEIAQRRYLSPRTVGAHLYRIFPKLGITSRAALRDALSSIEPAAPASGRRGPEQSSD